MRMPRGSTITHGKHEASRVGGSRDHDGDRKRKVWVMASVSVSGFGLWIWIWIWVCVRFWIWVCVIGCAGFGGFDWVRGLCVIVVHVKC
jgi:hypothetical protein